MTPTPLTPTSLIAVSVPKGAQIVGFFNSDTKYLLYTLPEGRGGWVKLGFPTLERYKVVGLVTKDTIDFDAHLHVSTHFNGLFTNYEQEDENAGDAFVETPEDSFRSLLSANECWFENPFPHPVDVDPAQRAHYDEIVADWQAAQSKVHECWAIIEKV